MNDLEIAHVLELAEDELVEVASPRHSQTKTRILWITVAAIACMAMLMTILFPYITHSKYDGYTVYITDDDYLGGKQVILSNKDNVVKMQLPTYRNMILAAQINYESVTQIANSIKMFNAETDPGIDLFCHWLSTQGSFDYRHHFSLFQRELVDEAFTSQALKNHYDYDSALARTEEVTSQVFQQYRFDFAFTVRSVEDSTDLYLSEGSYQGFLDYFQRAGLDYTKISEVRTYYIEDCRILMNGRFVNNNALYHSRAFVIYCYNGTWYVHPKAIEDDLSIDLLGKDVSYLNGIDIESGYVTEVGDHYFILGDSAGSGTVAYCFQDPLNISVGDYVTVEGYRCTIDVLLTEEPLTPDDLLKIDLAHIESKRIPFHSIKSVSITEAPLDNFEDNFKRE